jgi:perosamine synthetase
MTDLGFNYRLPDVQCALGISQVRKLPAWLSTRRALAARYSTLLRDVPGLRLPVEPPDRRHAWHLYPVRVAGDAPAARRRQLYADLRATGIGANVHYLPVYLHSYYQRLGYKPGCCPVSEKAYDGLLSLPMWHGMTEAQQDRVVGMLERFATDHPA